MILSSLKTYIKHADDVVRRMFNPDQIPVFYHDIENFGDQLTPYLLKKVYEEEIIIVKARQCQCLLGVGSILHFATNQTYVWGTGILDPIEFDKKDIHLDARKILA